VDLDQDLVKSKGDLKEIMMTKSQPEKRTKKGQSFRTTNAVVLNVIPAKFIKIGKLQ